MNKYNNLKIGDEVISTIDGATGRISVFKPNMGKMYITGVVNVDEVMGAFNDYYNVANWKRMVKSANQLKKPHRYLCEFDLSGYGKFVTISANVNKLIGEQLFSVSKQPRAKEKDASFGKTGSIWYAGDKFHEHVIVFTEQLFIVNLERQYNIKRATKQEIYSLPAGEHYFMMYIPINGNMHISSQGDVVECIKVNHGDDMLSWNEKGCPITDICHQDLSMINEDGSFVPSHGAQGDETGYLYVTNAVVSEVNKKGTTALADIQDEEVTPEILIANGYLFTNLAKIKGSEYFAYVKGAVMLRYKMNGLFQLNPEHRLMPIGEEIKTLEQLKRLDAELV